ncbi:MAG: Superoxide dismutase (Fe) [candidate division WS6 bacterium OLB20]|uniref:Superoxide dismutase n=1 Tax=candidate division WS6 bacterium OLB20 TaxID=1617426 RepID=A0A136LZA5_9BACT|nr:MAG: Superoxide dismutase (Fe) [candidate division WS6 bacterium OLB20]
MADQPYTLPALPWDADAVKDVLSEEVVNWHHQKHHNGYVAKANEIETGSKTADKSAANMNYSEYGEMKRRQSFNLSGIILHNIYWGVMGGDGSADESLAVVKKLSEDFGSFEAWKEDFAAVAKASLGWAILAVNPLTGKLENFLCDFHNMGAVWGAKPVAAIDVFEHAYYRDYGPDRAAYIDAFIGNLNWKAINDLYEA